MNHPNKTRLFLILFFLGFSGTLSLLLLDIMAIAALLPHTIEVPTITPALRLLSVVQPTVILILAILVGVALAHRVGLAAPATEALAAGGNVSQALKPQIVPGLAGGLLGGASIVLISALSKPFLLPETIDRISGFTKLMPLPTRLLYGGITEELLLRWGFMTLIVWAAWRVLQKQRNTPSNACIAGGILISSLVFGAGHLPVAYTLLPDSFSLALVLFVILANSAFGLVAGYLYWKRGLESAMIAHVFCHLVLAFASAAGAYF